MQVSMINSSLRFTDNGRVICVASLDDGGDLLSGDVDALRLFKSIRSIETACGARIFKLHYPTISILKDSIMEIFNVEKQLYGDKDSTDVTPELPVRMVCPMPTTKSSDSLLRFFDIAEIGDIVKADPNSVMCFADDTYNILRCINDNPSVFGFTMAVVLGVPDSSYTPEFDECTFSASKLSYETLTADLEEFERNKRLLNEQNQTDYDKERDGYTRKDGSVKALTGISVHHSADLKAEVEDTADEDL